MNLDFENYGLMSLRKWAFNGVALMYITVNSEFYLVQSRRVVVLGNKRNLAAHHEVNTIRILLPLVRWRAL